jgi:hypothetical protein
MEKRRALSLPFSISPVTSEDKTQEFEETAFRALRSKTICKDYHDPAVRHCPYILAVVYTSL